MTSDRVLIVGGGISGLATAFYLGKAGVPCTLIEKSNRLGGLIKTDHLNGCDLEAGPDSFIATKSAVAELARELEGLESRIIGSNDAARRIFVVRNGELIPMPKGMSMMVPSEWRPVLRSPLLSIGSKFRLLSETLKRPKTRDGDFSVGDLVASHFGQEMLDYVTEPLLKGVYGGDSSSLSARSVLPRFVGYEEDFGSLIRGTQAQRRNGIQPRSLFQSFEGGMQTLTDALSRAVLERTAVVHEKVSKVEKVESGWRVRIGAESISSRCAVLACPAWVGANLLSESAPAVSKELASIPYSSAILVTFVFAKSEFSRPLDGFGFLVPRQEPATVAAATWVNTKFPSRIAPEWVALRAFIVGQNARNLATESTDRVVETALSDIRRIMKVVAVPCFHTIHSWPSSMPQYVVGHRERIGRITNALQPYKGLFLCGNYFNGVGIPDCIQRAKQVSKQIAEDVV